MAMKKVILVDESKKINYYEKHAGGGEAFTVWRKSPVFRCEGFSVYDSTGNLVFWVDNYTGRPEKVLLMDGSGKPLFTTCRRKKFGLIENWVVYEGEVGKNTSTKKPMYYVRKNASFRQHNSNLLAHVYRDSSDKEFVYMIEGSYAHRSCRILDVRNQIKAEIKTKEATNSSSAVSFGSEVFQLMLRPGFSSKFTMAIILCLDQM